MSTKNINLLFGFIMAVVVFTIMLIIQHELSISTIAIVILISIPITINGNVFSFWGGFSEKNIYSFFSVFQDARKDAWHLFGLGFLQKAGKSAGGCFSITLFQKADEDAWQIIGLALFQKADRYAGQLFGVIFLQYAEKDAWQFIGVTLFKMSGRNCWQLIGITLAQEVGMDCWQGIGLVFFENAERGIKHYLSFAFLGNNPAYTKCFGITIKRRFLSNN
jgi:hypothetical protein